MSSLTATLEYSAGIAWHDAGNGCSSAASAMWRRGWLYAYHRALAIREFAIRNRAACVATQRGFVKYHVELARQYRMA